MNPKLLEILVCPQTKGRLIYNKEQQELISPLAECAYSIKDGIPIMLIDEARHLTEDEILKYKKKTS
ncbi:MAG: Trm112 family protein [Alphaproteobacteria bacterium]|nr:Trm112 family protein [Alphaproteobacteria bacterium]